MLIIGCDDHLSMQQIAFVDTETKQRGDLLHTMAKLELSHVRTELFQLLIIPFLAPHPVHPNRQSTGHRDLGDLPSTSHRQV